MNMQRAKTLERLRVLGHALCRTTLGGRPCAAVLALSVAAGAMALACTGRRTDEQGEPRIAARQVADMLHAVMEADRIAYTKQVINRLTKEQKVEIFDPEQKRPEPLRASEQWRSEHGTLPLPAQMFRMGAEAVSEKNVGVSYGLLSKWPINKQNKAKTEAEKRGLEAVLQSRGKAPFYETETLGDKAYFTAVYADLAVAPACVECHNSHRDSPRSDFKLGDVMGGVVVRIPIGG
jgi:hypothetical protein